LSRLELRVVELAGIDKIAGNEVPMQKKYIVRLTDQERKERMEVVKKPKGTSQKVRRAQILLEADADGPN
jgi:hypothetical protein